MNQIQEIILSDLYIPISGTRTTNYDDDGIQDLVEHIEIHGLLEPIVVFAVDDLSEDHVLYESRKKFKGKYEILMGRRRLNAFRILNGKFSKNEWEKIPCIVRVPPQDETDGKAISFGAGITIVPISLKDAIDVCTSLYQKYNDLVIVSKMTGISRHLIRKYVKFTRLPKLLRDNLDYIHKNPKTAVNLAVEAADALVWTGSGDVSEEKVFELAKMLGDSKRVSFEKYKKLRHAAEKYSKEPLDIIEEEAMKIMKPIKYSIFVDAKISHNLEKLAEINGRDPNDELSNILAEAIDLRLSDE